jgi:hypothetical protein
MRSLSITDLTGDAPQPVRQLSGAALMRLSAAAKRRLLTLSLEDPRRRPLGVRADADALILYLSTSLPVGEAVSVQPEWGVGVIGRDGRSLAYVSGRGRTIGALAAHGGDTAERRLADAVRVWVERGRPGPEHLLVEVAYRGTEARVRARFT